MKVHSAIGPGVLESVYRKCLQYELKKLGFEVQSEVKLPVENRVVVELKCVDALLPIHKAQLLTYLQLANKPLGLLLNFNVVHMREGIKRVLNNRCVNATSVGQS